MRSENVQYKFHIVKTSNSFAQIARELASHTNWWLFGKPQTGAVDGSTRSSTSTRSQPHGSHAWSRVQKPQ